MRPAPNLNDPIRCGEEVVIPGIGIRMNESVIICEDLAGALLAPIFREIEDPIGGAASSNIDPHGRLLCPTESLLKQAQRRVVREDGPIDRGACDLIC